jgi:hypothetical protein|tara:strand:- start:1794 stop:1976 length:183 start_codon:yes stop_codon:yes gene_type:complete
MKGLTIIQVAMISVVIAHAYSMRKTNIAAVSTFALAVILLHMYDHVFLVKRGEERRLFNL